MLKRQQERLINTCAGNMRIIKIPPGYPGGIFLGISATAKE
jgi:hypothetical protein